MVTKFEVSPTPAIVAAYNPANRTNNFAGGIEQMAVVEEQMRDSSLILMMFTADPYANVVETIKLHAPLLPIKVNNLSDTRRTYTTPYFIITEEDI